MDDDQEICRVCRCESTPDHPLFHPCKCSGSIRFVHEDCLIEWLSHSRKKYCELCEHPFTFSPIYREDMPDRLPFYVLCTQFVRRFTSLLKTALRGLTVIFVWLIMLPNFTLWTWRFYFWSGENIGFVPKSYYQSPNDTSNHGSNSNVSTLATSTIGSITANMTNSTTVAITTAATTNARFFWLNTIKSFLSDCLEGQVITAFVIIIFVAGYLFREWVMQNLPAEQPRIFQQPQPVLRRQANNRRNLNVILDENEDNRNQLLQEQAALDTLMNAMRVLPNDNNEEELAAAAAEENHFEDTEMIDNGLNAGQPLHRQLNNVRVELDNELNGAREDNLHRQSNDWTPIFNDRVVRNDDQLFGGIDMNRASSSNTHGSQNTQDITGEHHFASFNQQPQQHDEVEEQRDETAEETDDHDDNESLPDLVDEEQRRLNREAFHNMIWEHLANQGLPVPAEEARQPVEAPNEDERQQLRQAALGLLEEVARREGLENFHDALAGQAAAAQPQQQPQPVRDNNAGENEDDDEPLDVGDDINGVLEAIGMRGNPWMLVQNSVLMSLMISLCLGVAIWIPYVIGRLVILIRPISFIETPIYLMRLITDPLVDFVLDLCLPFVWSHVEALMPANVQLAISSLQDRITGSFHSFTASPPQTNQSAIPASAAIKSALETTADSIVEPFNNSNLNLTNTILSTSPIAAVMNMDWNTAQSKLEQMSTLALARWHRFATDHTALDRGVCILVGYLVLIFVGSWYLNHSQSSNASTLNNNRRRALAAAAAANARVNGNHQIIIPRDTIRDLIRQQGIFLKVLFFILIELVVFPTVCGFLLDFATLPLFANASLTTRYLFHLKRPYFSYFAHWFLGTGVLFYFAIFITVCREIIRPGVMWFIRDPNDPQFHPVQEMVERPFPNLLHKISQSALIYSFMLVFGVGTVTYTLSYINGVFPLNLPFDNFSLSSISSSGANATALTSVAVDLLIVQFLVPPLVKFINPRAVFKRALGIWWRIASRQLRLTSFMFNERRLDEEGYHQRRSLKAWLTREKADVPNTAEDIYSEVAIDNESDASVVFKRNGMMVRVPKYDSVPVDPKRRMLVPVDPVTLEAIDEDERIHGHPAAADTNDESQATIVVYIPPYFKQRTIFFLFYMWLFISLFACSVTVLPLLTGRFLLNKYCLSSASTSKMSDLYSFTLGIYLMTGFGVVAHWAKGYYNQYRNSNDHEQFYAFIKEKAGKTFKFFYLATIVGIILPSLFAVVVDLYVFLPIQNVDRNFYSISYFSMNWSLGIAYLSLLHNLFRVLPANNLVRRRVNEIIGGENFMQTDVLTITRTVIGPVILCTLLAIIVPSMISWAIVQTLESKDAFTQVSVTRYAYPAIFGMCLIILIVLAVKKMLTVWLETVRDDTYLIGKRLHNMPTSEEETGGSSGSGSNP